MPRHQFDVVVLYTDAWLDRREDRWTQFAASPEDIEAKIQWHYQRAPCSLADRMLHSYAVHPHSAQGDLLIKPESWPAIPQLYEKWVAAGRPIS